MTNRDDMVIRPQITTAPNSPRVRAAEERRSRSVGQKRGGLMRKLRLARAVSRRNKRGRGKHRGPKATGKAAKKASSLKPKPGWIGVAMLAVDALAVGTELHRRWNGASARLVSAENAHTVMADLDEQVTANAEVLGAMESDSDLLKAIGRDNKVNASTMQLINEMKAMALTRARGDDMLNRDPHFDSKDTMLDKMIMKSEAAGLKDKADEAIEAIRGQGFGKMKTGR